GAVSACRDVTSVAASSPGCSPAAVSSGGPAWCVSARWVVVDVGAVPEPTPLPPPCPRPAAPAPAPRDGIALPSLLLSCTAAESGADGWVSDCPGSLDACCEAGGPWPADASWEVSGGVCESVGSVPM